MNDLIDRQALLERITKTICRYCDDSKCTECALDNGIFIINTQDNVEPKKGEWRRIGGRYGYIFGCSECNNSYPYKTNFCPTAAQI